MATKAELENAIREMLQLRHDVNTQGSGTTKEQYIKGQNILTKLIEMVNFKPKDKNNK